MKKLRLGPGYIQSNKPLKNIKVVEAMLRRSRETRVHAQIKAPTLENRTKNKQLTIKTLIKNNASVTSAKV